MTTLLRVEASARVARSLSRGLSDAFFDAWRSRCPQDRVISRDVGQEPPAAVSEDWIAGAFADESNSTDAHRQALALSDTLIDEVLQSDIIVIATPMYNYGMPSALKAWFDQVIRVHKTFSFDLARGDEPIEPIQSGKTLVVLSAHGEGGFLEPGRQSERNHLHPHILECAKLLGVERHHFVAIEYQEFRDERHEHSKRTAHASIGPLVARLIDQRGGAVGGLA